MQLGLVGLGRMGANMARRLMQDGHEVIATDLDPEAVRSLAREGAGTAADLKALIHALTPPRALWLMVPAGKPTESLVKLALEQLEAGDILVDGADSDWRDSHLRGATAAEQGIHFIDAGVSGGVWGLAIGYNLMVGGSPEGFAAIEPLLRTLAPENGYAHVGPPGAGHFVKMIHNGIEYALLQAYGEGFEALAAYPHADLELDTIATLWTNGSVIRSWLLELAASALGKHPDLEHIHDDVADSGMGRWTLEFGVDHAVPLPAISAALFARFASRQEESFSSKVVAALRQEFGGHAVKEK